MTKLGLGNINILITAVVQQQYSKQ